MIAKSADGRGGDQRPAFQHLVYLLFGHIAAPRVEPIAAVSKSAKRTRLRDAAKEVDRFFFHCSTCAVRHSSSSQLVQVCQANTDSTAVSLEFLHLCELHHRAADIAQPLRR